MRRRYQKKRDATVVAVQLNLEFSNFQYLKWGNAQHCKPGDWLINNRGDVYTVDKDVFAKTYHKITEGVYRKEGTIWAKKMNHSGHIETMSGKTNYKAGDYLVSNNEDGSDAYAIDNTTFHIIYEEI